MGSILCALISVYLLVLFARAIMSWIPVRPGTPWASLYGILLDLTEPVLAPMRKIIPPAGMLDLSFLVVMFGLFIIRGIVCSY